MIVCMGRSWKDNKFEAYICKFRIFDSKSGIKCIESTEENNTSNTKNTSNIINNKIQLQQSN